MATGDSKLPDVGSSDEESASPHNETNKAEGKEIPNKKNDDGLPTNGDLEDDDGCQEFDFTNPEMLVQQLEKVDLTEEDTDELLREAYKVNMKLKEILRRQEVQEAKRRQRMASAQSAYGTAATGTGPKVSRSHGSSALPPIQRKSTAIRESSKPAGSAKSKSSRSSASSSKSGKEKPVWDDRFSYT